MRTIRTCTYASFAMLALSLFGQDAELTNYKSGIDVIWGGTKGVDYYEEYFYHDKLISDAKVVYIKSTTPISMAHNGRNTLIKASTAGGRTIIGVNGEDGVPNSGDEGIIRYKIDRDRQYRYKWSNNSSGTEAYVLPAYSTPFTLASQTYAESAASVVGSTGFVTSSGAASSDFTNKSSYFRGLLDSFGDEWHVLAYADDDRNIPNRGESASDGKTVLLVVNPKTPCFTARATGTGQFYTTPPKAYFTPKIVPQTTYMAPGSSGNVSIELRDINGNNVFYRINGGAFIDAGAASVTLSDSSFNSGSNTLEYYYAGNAAFTKTRIVIKNPPHPSLSETHGYYLFENPSGLAAAQNRVTRPPYSSTYNAQKTRGDFSGQNNWDQWAGKGYRINPIPTSYLQGGSQALINAFIALNEGYSYTRTGSSKSFGEYAKEMILENSRTINPLGFELSHSADTIPSRELHYRGYYDSAPVLHTVFAYDIIVANFRSNQVVGGITPIEDYFVRDSLAGFAYEAMQWSANMTSLGAPLMWGGARMMCAVSIAMIMSNYSTPYYGTSGFGTIQTTYPLCPYQNDQLTWKQVLFDATAPKTAYPNLAYYLGISDNGIGGSLFFSSGETWGPNSYPEGTWIDKAAYFSTGLMGIHLQIWANMAKMWGGGKTDPRLEIAFENASKGTFIGAKDPYPQTPERITQLLVTNKRWPNIVSNSLSYIQSLPSTDPDSDDKGMNVFAYALYDDQASVSVPITSPAISTQPASSTVTAGSSASFSVSASGSPPLAYQWTFNGSPISGATSATYNISSVSSGQAGTYSVVVTNSAGSATSANASLTVNAAPPVIVSPAITTQPANSTVTTGTSASFSVSVTGTAPLAYQWRRNGADISGATSSSYSILSTSSGDAGTYSVLVSNAGGSVTSANATLTVNPPPAIAPTITTQPANSTVTAGGSASFSVSASGTAPLSFQWRLNGSPIGGATSATYNIASVSAGQAGTYSVVVSNSAGSVTSANASLTVNALPPPVTSPSIITQPASSTVTTGASVAFTVSATGSAPLSYQWRLNGSPINGATGATHSIANATSGLAGLYSVVVSNSNGSVTSADATLTVNPPPPVAPTITTQPASSAVSVGASASFTVAVSGTLPFTYQWRLNGSPIGGATAGTYSIFSATAGQAGTYSVVVSNAGGSVTSADATLTVNAVPPPVVAPSITTQPANSTITEGASASFSVTASGSVPLTYQWRFNGTPINGATSATYSISNASTSQTGAYSVVVTNSAGSATSSNANLTVNALPPPPPSVVKPSDATINIR